MANGAMGGPPMGPPMGGPPMGGPQVGGPMGAPNPDALMQELSALAMRAQEIMAQLQSMGIDPSQIMGGPPAPNGGPDMMGPPPQMPPEGGMPPGLLA